MDGASLGILRILFGGMMVYSLVRFVAQGWIEKVLVAPSFFFKFPGFGWTFVGSPNLLYAQFIVAATLAGMVSIGVFYRTSVVLFWLSFTYLQLLDVTLYLNHYYLVVLVSGLLIFMPAHRCFSVDRWRKGWRGSSIPRWVIWLLRFQVAVVYLNAALAKLQPDWLLLGEPMGLWMRARTDIPILGPWLNQPWVPLIMSWMGFLYDLTIWLFLLWKPSRPAAYLTVVLFHGLTALFFEIGMFPVIMIVVTTVFFEPDWPRRIGRTRWRRPRPETISSEPSRLGWVGAGAVVLYMVIQVGLPLRHYFYAGDVLWNERGMRFAWKVMVREKNGDVVYRVRLPSGKEREVDALHYLTWRQYSDMSGQPDLIYQLGRHIAWDFRRKGLGPVEVRVDAWVSLNGRRPQPLVDPTVDIEALSPSKLASWILPGPTPGRK